MTSRGSVASPSSRKAKPKKPEIVSCDSPAFYTWLKSRLRRICRLYPPYYKSLEKAKSVKWIESKEAGQKKLKRVFYTCAHCNEKFTRKQIAVDHIFPVVAVKLGSDKPDWNVMIERLFCSVDGFQCLCRACHSIKSAEERAERKLYANKKEAQKEPRQNKKCRTRSRHQGD